MKLYDLKNGLNPRRVRIFLAEKGISIPSEFVDMMKGENKAQTYLAINPMGLMPVLEFDDGTHLAESIAICRYFEELHPQPPLFGTTTLERAQIEMWNRRMELEIQLPIQDVFVHLNPFWAGRRPQVPEYGRVQQARVLERMAWLNRELADRPYIAGDHYTVADITAQCALVMGKGTGSKIPDDLTNLTR
ncbi:MAG: glutathione S-transferase family protein, partial [Methylobacteriaceae bacterium]|nr:glutathione S-transferase family protein [Methylobacteriaceae bacterium]